MVCVGRRILPKCEILDEAEDCLSLLSGRAHRVYTGLALTTPSGATRSRLVETRVRFKRLSRGEIAAYLASGEWRGKAGGYAIQGLAGAFVRAPRRLLHQRRRPAARRDGGAARRRGLRRPSRLDAGSVRAMAKAAKETARTERGRQGSQRLRRSAASPRDPRYDPFCSRRCADVDLHRWLKGGYVIPGGEPASPEGEEEE